MCVSANIAAPKSCLLYLKINNSVTSFPIHEIVSNCRRPIIYLKHTKYNGKLDLLNFPLDANLNEQICFY